MKSVTYMNQSFDVPEEAKYIAADADGEVFWYAEEPKLSSTGCWLPADINDNHEYIGDITNKFPLEEI